MNNHEVAKELMKIAKDLLSMDYDDKVKAIMKKWNISSPAELSESDKKKYFKELDDSHVSEKEKADGEG